MDLFEYDRSLNVPLLCGVDEAGRGPLAGDVYAAAVILPPDAELPGLNDSKKLSEKKREALYDLICAQAVSYCVATATPEEIDRLNILNATFVAMQRAIDGLSVPPDYVLIDGNRRPATIIQPCSCVVKGDATSASIAAASILAKVSRDRYMKQIAERYPEYGFTKHKGYPTKDHYAAIAEYGVLDIHRKSFLKKMAGASEPNAHLRGVIGERATAEWYLEHGYEVTARNVHSTYGEIDLIVENGEYLVFCEVKTRKTGSPMAPAAAVGARKQKKIIQTALGYLAEHGMEKQPRFDVAEVLLEGGTVQSVNVIENAFTVDGMGILL